MRRLKLQSAMEYLMTYSWAILVIALVLAALFALGLFNPGSVLSSQCILPAGLSCVNVYMVSNGLVSINLLQATTTPINITAWGCNANQTVAHMYCPGGVCPAPPANQIKMQIGANYTYNVECWGGSSTISGSPGSLFRGYLIINYTEFTTGFPHTIVGQLQAKVT
jgi:hypothetical protein